LIFPSLAQLATRDVVTLDVSHTLKEALQLMNEHHIRDVIVTQGQTYRILTARELIDFQIKKIPLSTPLKDLALNIVPQMSADDNVMKALMVVQNHPDNHVCLINKDRDLIGIISYSDLAASLQPDQLVQSQPIGELIGDRTFLRVAGDDDLQTVFERMHQLKETAAIVMQHQQAVGMMTQSNIIELLDKENNWQKPVADYMSSPLLSVDASASVQYALAMSREHHIKHLVVQDQQQKVIGVLHQKDLVSLVYQALYERFENETRRLQGEMDLLRAGPVVSLIWKSEPGWPVKYITPNVLSILGYEVSEFVSPHFYFSELIHPDDLERITQEVEQALANKLSYWDQRYRLLSKQGRWRWFYDYSQPIYGADDQVEEIFGYLLDQTHLIETEQALTQSEQQYRLLFEFYPLATVLFDPITQLPVQFNQQAHQQLGYSAEVFKHLRISDYEVIESEQKVKEHMADILAKGEAHFETQHRHKSGKILEIKVTCRVLKLNGQDYILSVFEDISELKQSQQAFQAAHQKQLAASEEKMQFMAYLSHEIRTPMMGILGICELAQDYHDVTDFKAAATQVANAGQQLMSLINDFLDLSKLEANQLILKSQPIALNALMNELMGLAQGIKKVDQPIEMHLQYDEALPAVLYGDGQRLKQVLLNLLSNAIKFTEQGHVTLEVRLMAQKNGQAWVKFSVSDSGIGLSSAALANLFKPYHQAPSTQSAEGGTGLGLVISQQLVQLMKGTGIAVSSALGKGSCFAFEVPLAIETDQQVEVPPSTSDGEIKPLQGRILVAEDDAINQQVIRQQLNSLGISDIVMVGDGEQAVTQARKQSFDLVLMDLQMPKLNGFEASQRLLEAQPDLAIIALSAADSESDRLLAEQNGMKSYLVKPVSLQRLYAVLAGYLPGAPQSMTEIRDVRPNDKVQLSAESFSKQTAALPIDFQRGIAQLNGNHSLYLKLLKQFLAQLNHQYADLAGELMEASLTTVNAADLSEWQAKNHSMKGVAGNLALMALHEVSQKIDIELKQQRLPGQRLIQSFNQIINETKQAIQNTLNLETGRVTTQVIKHSEPSPSQPLTVSELQNALTDLLKALHSQRYMSSQQLQPLWDSIPPAMQPEYGAPLMAAIDNFEFDRASVLVGLLLEALQEQED